MRGLKICIALVLLSSPAFAVAKVQEVQKNVWLIEDHSLPIVTVKAQYENSGAAADPKGKEGLFSFVSQLLDEGAGDMDSLAFHQALEDSAIRFNADANEDSLSVTMQTLSQFKDKAFTLFNLALNRPRFDAEAVERIRASIISDLKQAEQNPGYIASRTWKEKAFPNHPYQHPRRGTQSSVATITADDLKAAAAYDFSQCGTRRIISVVGDITAAETKDWLKKLDATQSSALCGAVAAAAPDIVVSSGDALPVMVDNPAPQTVVQVGLPGIKRTDSGYYAAYVMAHILGGGDSLTSRLGKTIRDKRGLAYYVGTELEVLDHSEILYGFFATRNAEAQTALNLFLDELKKMQKDGASKEELADAKGYITGSFPLEIDNQNALAEYLLMMERFGLGSDYLEKRNAIINAVTLKQVNDAAKKLLSPVPLIVMVGQKQGAKAP